MALVASEIDLYTNAPISIRYFVGLNANTNTIHEKLQENASATQKAKITSLNSFRFYNEEYVDVEIKETLGGFNIENVNYLEAWLWGTEGAGFWKRYYVIKIERRSIPGTPTGNASEYRLYLKLDLWATYIHNAQFKHVIATKTNVNLPIEQYLTQGYNLRPCPFERRVVTNAADSDSIDLSALTRDDLCIYFNVEISTTRADSSNVFTELYVVPIYRYDDKWSTTSDYNAWLQIDEISSIGIKTNLISKITKIRYVEGGDTDNCKVTGIFVAPYNGTKQIIGNISVARVTFIANEYNEEFNLCSAIYAYTYSIEATAKIDTLSVTNRLIGTSDGIAAAMPLSYGTKGTRLALPKILGNISVRVKFEFSHETGVRSILNYEGGQQDISEAFKAGFTGGTYALDEQQRISKTISIVGQAVSAGSQIAIGASRVAGGDMLGVASVASGITGLAQTFADNRLGRAAGQIIGGGISVTLDVSENRESPQAKTNFYYFTMPEFDGITIPLLSFYVIYPERYNAGDTTKTVLQQIINVGAECNYVFTTKDEFKSTLSGLTATTGNVLGGINVDNLDLTEFNFYIAAEAQDVENVPQNAADEIKRILRNGTYFIPINS